MSNMFADQLALAYAKLFNAAHNAPEGSEKEQELRGRLRLQSLTVGRKISKRLQWTDGKLGVHESK